MPWILSCRWMKTNSTNSMPSRPQGLVGPIVPGAAVGGLAALTALEQPTPAEALAASLAQRRDAAFAEHVRFAGRYASLSTETKGAALAMPRLAVS